MAVGMHELTENDVREFVKELEKRRIPLHSVLVAQHDKLLLEKIMHLMTEINYRECFL
mgnify:CR=1 FL=1